MRAWWANDLPLECNPHLPSWILKSTSSTKLGWMHNKYGPKWDLLYKSLEGEIQNCAAFTRILRASLWSFESMSCCMKFNIGSIQLEPSSILTRTDSYCILRLGSEINLTTMVWLDSPLKTMPRLPVHLHVNLGPSPLVRSLLLWIRWVGSLPPPSI